MTGATGDFVFDLAAELGKSVRLEDARSRETWDWRSFDRDRRRLGQTWEWDGYDGHHNEIPTGLDYAELPEFAKRELYKVLSTVRSAQDAPRWIRHLMGAPWRHDLQHAVDALQAVDDQEREELFSSLRVQAAEDADEVKVAAEYAQLRIRQLAKERLQREAEGPQVSIRELIERDTVAALLDEDLPAALLDGHLDAGSLARLVGEPGDGKTFIAIHTGMCLAAGRRWRNGVETSRTRVVYIAAEGGRRFFGERLQAWAARYNDGVVPGPQWFTPIVDRIQILSKRFDELMAAFDPERGGESAGLFIFDTQAKTTEGVDENSNTEAAQIERRISELAERTGAAVLLLHHPAYGTKRGRGASAVTGAMDSEWFVSQDESTGIVTMETTKQKHHPMGAKFVWTIESQAIATKDGHRSAGVVVEADPIDTVGQQKTADHAVMLAVVVARPGLASGAYSDDEEIRPATMSRPRARVALQHLREAFEIHVVNGPKNSKLVHPGPPPEMPDDPFGALPVAPESGRKRGSK